MSLTSLATVLLTAIGIYALMVLFVYHSQERMLFLPNLPTRSITATPDRIGLNYETVEISTADSVQLHGWFVAASTPKGTILFFHGNAGNISHRLDSLKIFHDLGYSVLIIDYRGYGQSTGRPTENGTYLDAQAAWRYLTSTRGVPAGDIVLFGRSLGAAIAAFLAAEVAPRALVLESAFTSVPDIAAELYPHLPVRMLSRLRYSTRKALQGVRCPVLVVHSPDDEIIPYRHGEALYQSANGPKAFLSISGSHNEGFVRSGARYRDGLADFLEQYAGTRKINGVTR